MTDATAGVDRAYRVRLRPTEAQAHMFRRLLGARRFVWNWALARKERAWREEGINLTSVDLSREFTVMRAESETAWLSELPRAPFVQLMRDFDRAWRRYFAGRAKPPRRKRRGECQSFRVQIPPNRAIVDDQAGTLQLDRIGKVRFRVSEPIRGRPTSATIIRDGAGRWFASILASDVPVDAMAAAVAPIAGVCIGRDDAVTLSTGLTFAVPKRLDDKLARLRRYKRGYARQQAAALRAAGGKKANAVDSRRMQRRKQRIATLYERIADLRRDHHQQLTTAAVAAAQVVVLDHPLHHATARLGRSARRNGIPYSSPGEIRRQLEYKARWYGREVRLLLPGVDVDRACAGCGVVELHLPRPGAAWQCQGCGRSNEWAANAAANIERFGALVLPQMSTPGRGGIDARGEGSGAAGALAPVGQPASKKREPARSAASPRPSNRAPRKRAGSGGG